MRAAKAFVLLMVFGAVALTVLFLLGRVAVHWIADGPPERVWAVVFGLLVPIVGVASYRLGRIEARGAMTGLDMGISRVSEAAAKTAEVRVGMARELKRRPDDPPIIDLPMLPGPRIVSRQIGSGEREVQV